jgi:hypothetical protein
MSFMADTIAAIVLALAMVGIGISVTGLILDQPDQLIAQRRRQLCHQPVPLYVLARHVPGHIQDRDAMR